MADIIKSRRDTAENWKSANPTLAEGELGFETDTKRYKLGDGKKAWNDLEYRDIDVDELPTEGSRNFVNSGAVYEAFHNEQFVDDEPIAGSEKLVTSGGIAKNYAKSVKTKQDVFYICDANGNVILKLNGYLNVNEDGNIETTSFDSDSIKQQLKNIGDTSVKVVSDNNNNLLSICDNQGNVICKFNDIFAVDENGNIKTRAFESNLCSKIGRAQFPKINYHKETFSWLDIGNSHSLCQLYYVDRIAKSLEIDDSKIAFCTASRGAASFKSWYQGLHDLDKNGEGDNLTGAVYNIKKYFGKLPIKVTGNKYDYVGADAVRIEDTELTSTSISFWGGDCSLLRSLLEDNQFDLITIHQRHVSNTNYDISDGWTDHSEDGYAVEFIRYLKTKQPQATIGLLSSVVPYGYTGNNLSGIDETFKVFAKTMQRFMNDYGIDFVLPCDTALENIRHSSIVDVNNEFTGKREDIESRRGLCYDSSHTTYGIASYVMSCVAWELVFAPRFGISMYGNTYQELREDDLTSYKPDNLNRRYLQGSYINKQGEKVMIDSGAWGAPLWVGCTSADDGRTWVSDWPANATIRVTPENAKVCQMAAISAVNDMWNINNVDDTDI